jgi:nucleoside 2-deoxyribosyltransferase
MIKKIYISGPISGLPNGNKQAFDDAERMLTKCGFVAVNPHRNGLPPTATWAEHMSVDLVLLTSCDGVAVLPGCNKSKGAALEIRQALHHGQPVKTVWDWL